MPFRDELRVVEFARKGHRLWSQFPVCQHSLSEDPVHRFCALGVKLSEMALQAQKQTLLGGYQRRNAHLERNRLLCLSGVAC